MDICPKAVRESSTLDASKVKPLNFSIAQIMGQDNVHSSGTFPHKSFIYFHPKNAAPNTYQ